MGGSVEGGIGPGRWRREEGSGGKETLAKLGRGATRHAALGHSIEHRVDGSTITTIGIKG